MVGRDGYVGCSGDVGRGGYDPVKLGVASAHAERVWAVVHVDYTARTPSRSGNASGACVRKQVEDIEAARVVAQPPPVTVGSSSVDPRSRRQWFGILGTRGSSALAKS